MNRSTTRDGRCISFTSYAILVSTTIVLPGILYSPALAEPSAARSGEDDGALKNQGDIDRLLAQARQAMAAGKYQQADEYLRTAESAKPRYPVLHFGDTPARVRRDLDRLQGSRANGQEATSTSVSRTENSPRGVSLPSFSNSKGEIENPFATQTSVSLGTQEEAPLPSAERTTPGIASHVALPASENATEARGLSDQQLLAARQALLVGDADKAKQHLSTARELNVNYSESDDSPEHVERLVAQFEQLQASKDDTVSWRQGYAEFLVTQSESLLSWNDWGNAERAASEAAGLYTKLGIEDPAPLDLLSRIQAARSQQPESAGQGVAQSSVNTLEINHRELRLEDYQVAQASGAIPIDLTLPDFQQHSVVPSQTTPRLIAQSTGEGLRPLPAADEEMPELIDARSLMRAGEDALRAGNRGGALKLFQQAYSQRQQLDLASQQQLQDHLQMLSGKPEQVARGDRSDGLLDKANVDGTVLARQISAEVGKRQTEASRLRTSEPRKSLQMLEDTSELVANSELDENTKTQLLRRISLTIAETERYIKDNQADLELDEANQAVIDDIERSRAVKQQVREKMAVMVDQFNQLRDEQRYAEMEVVAKRLYDMAPNEPVAQQVWENSKFIRRTMLNRELDAMGEEGFVKIQQGIRRSSVEGLLQGDDPIRYADNWLQLKDRKGSSEASIYNSAKSLEIRRKLRTPVLPRYNEMPLTEVVKGLSELTDMNIHLDPRGLSQEGIDSNVKITLNLGQEISLESVLNLILEPLHLTYTIKDEVLKITSEQLRDGDLVRKVYNVADLVIPIPNFVPSSNMGLQGLLNDAYESMPFSNGSRGGGPVAMTPANMPGQQGGAMPGSILGQQLGAGGPGSSSVPVGGGPGGLGGAAMADFDSLIDLIISTVEYDTWMENGTGEGEIQPFPNNLSLVVSQTQRVHEQIADLLEQLRRLQDLQVTIEVRFIRLSDQFFERIGLDFDFNIRNGSSAQTLASFAGNPNVAANQANTTVGISAAIPETSLGIPYPTFTGFLDIPFRQNSSALATPQFGAPADIGQFGFAILSDIEAFFLLNASQGDRRANILQAPKVTLFNGQQGMVVDSSFRPFVISVIPVVGEFAAAQQPVIVVLSEGTLLTVQAVVSDDRRYVRLTLVPFFSQVGRVETFTFEGSETTSTSSSTTDPDEGAGGSESEARQVTRSGTTVQLPTFEVISVATTVSVPDGGTVLLGGIKRLSENRSEFGIPLLSKIPYVDRLFRNVGIGRETDSLMMMVTPHIIIQEEEEERLGIGAD